MRSRRWIRNAAAVVLLFLVAVTGCAQSSTPTDPSPLPSWKEGPAKAAILEFVAAVTDESGKDYVKPSERIAVFDNDGTLWVEQPMYTQLLFAFDRVKALAPQHPEWKTTQPFKGVLGGDMQAVAASGKHGLLKLMMATHAGMTTTQFEQIVEDWIAAAKHPKFKRPYTDLVYQPMLELLAYLRANGFKTYITSGGGIEFMRPWTERVYGIPPEQVIGSSIRTKFEMRQGKPVLVRLPELFFLDDKEDKPVAIQKFIGRQPILAFGNSDGDLQMLQYTASGSGLRLMLLLHHDDGQREYAYDRDSHVGRLDKALDEAARREWIIVSMKNDFGAVFPPPPR